MKVLQFLGIIGFAIYALVGISKIFREDGVAVGLFALMALAIAVFAIFNEIG